MYTDKFVKLAWILTFLGFLIALSLSYAFLPIQVGIQADANGNPDQLIDRETFFYLALGAFVFVNVICLISFRVLNALPASSPVFYRSELFKDRIRDWFAAFTTVINIFLICTVSYISLFNNQGDYQIGQFNWIMWVGPLLFVGVVIWFFFILVSPKPINTEA
ncbi:MAG: hypothetical protein WBA23_11125 [Tunicatimonas sp.]|uniref:hypothetical protein n=1 Tax=Tunicatimonas sp. TaxID=1940096 RepID=UPI003C76B0A9